MYIPHFCPSQWLPSIMEVLTTTPPPEGTMLHRASRKREQRSCGGAKLSRDFRNTAMGFLTTEKK